MTPKVWCIHNNEPSLKLVQDGFVSIGWEELGDLAELVSNKEALKTRLLDTFPDAKPGAIPGWAGTLRRFVLDIQIGDIVIAPNKSDRTLSLGTIAGDYYFDPSATLHPNRRKVTWHNTGIPRAQFSEKALYEIGSVLTVFAVKRHANEFAAALEPKSNLNAIVAEPATAATSATVDDAETAEETPNASRVEEFTRDRLETILRTGLSPSEFEEFIAALLRAMGYYARVTSYSGDGGIDVIAHRDAFGLEGDIIKVQCKQTISPIGGPAVQALLGAVAEGEKALFVSLGGYTRDAEFLDRSKHALRLLRGTDLIDLLLRHYESLDDEWRQRIPMRRVYAVDVVSGSD